MNRFILVLTVCIGITVLAGPTLLRAQGNDQQKPAGQAVPAQAEAPRVSARNAPADQNPSAPGEAPQAVVPEIHLATDRAVKYNAGPDGKWFTRDDGVIEYTVSQHDARMMAKEERYSPGTDGVAFNGDDQLLAYVKFEYAPDGKMIKSVTFNPQGQIQTQTVYEYNGDILWRDIEYGPDGREILNVHRFETDKRGQMIRMHESRGKRGGMGPDNQWLTPDDVTTNVVTFVYRGTNKIRDLNFMEPGPDGQWFTKDDVMESYALYQYKK